MPDTPIACHPHCPICVPGVIAARAPNRLLNSTRIATTAATAAMVCVTAAGSASATTAGEGDRQFEWVPSEADGGSTGDVVGEDDTPDDFVIALGAVEDDGPALPDTEALPPAAEVPPDPATQVTPPAPVTVAPAQAPSKRPTAPTNSTVAAPAPEQARESAFGGRAQQTRPGRLRFQVPAGAERHDREEHPVAPRSSETGPEPVASLGAAEAGAEDVAEPSDSDRETGAATYTVRPGDTLWSIASARAASPNAGAVAAYVTQLWDINSTAIGTGNPDVLPAGVELSLPR